MTLDASTQPEVHLGRLVTLKEIGLGEHWVQDWLVKDPSRLGLGTLKVVDQEQMQSGGGVLDILATSGDVYYSIEVQLGEVDASHGFRVFDYWTRNRRKQPGKTHVAVLVAESATGRYRVALEALAEFTPLLVIELRAWRGATETVIVPEAVIRNESLDLQETPLATSDGVARTSEDWQSEIKESAWDFHLALYDWVKSALGKDVRVDYSPKSYIGLRVGRRVWCPVWPVADGGTIHLPDPDGSKDEESPAYEYFREQLIEAGLAPSWTPTYNAGANPITVRLNKADLEKPAVQQLLRASYRFLAEKAAWSDEQSVESDGTDSETTAGETVEGLKGLPLGEPISLSASI